MEPPWEEALDVDDSDLHSSILLRPCKQLRRHHQTNPTTFTPHSSQTLNSLPASDDKPIPLFRIIPGPSGILQVAKLRKARDNNSLLSREDMTTQEYMRRVVEDPEDDGDFKSNLWLYATESVSCNGMPNCVASAPLGDIKKHMINGKLDQVVAVIKSCTPNGLGDLMVVLKDPTGTVSGTIHHKVLTECEFGDNIFVGSVLILHKVSVFSPSRAAHYLNITTRNLVKVIHKDSGPSQKETLLGRTIKEISKEADRYGSNLVDNLNKKGKEVHVEVEQVPRWTDEQLNELLDGI